MTKRPRPPGAYEIGYGKPPEAHRFKQGQSGNPKGRKKKQSFRSVAFSVFDELNRVITVKEGGKSKRMPVGEAVAKRFMVEVMNGNTRALQAVLKLVDTLPAEFKDRSVMNENRKKAEKLFVHLLDKYAAYKSLYGDLPPKTLPQKDTDKSGDDQ